VKFKNKQKVEPVKKNLPSQLTVSSELSEIITSSRVYEQNSKAYIDYMIAREYRTDMEAGRKRFSTGKEWSPRVKQQVERDKFALALNHFLENNKFHDKNNIKFSDLADEALEEGRFDRTEDVQNDYITIYKTHIYPVFGKKNIDEIRLSDLKQWKNNLLSSKQLSRGRYLKYHRVLNFIFKYAFQNEFIDKDIMQLVDKKSKAFVKSEDSSSKYYTKDEVKVMLKGSDGWFNAFLTFIFYSAVRTGEAMGLQWSDIDFLNNKITISRSIRQGRTSSTKTGTVRTIDIAEPLKKVLLAYKNDAPQCEWVFPNPKTLKPYYESTAIVKRFFKPLLKELGIEYRTIYASRASYASLMLEAQAPMSYIQAQLGHANISTTMTYYLKNGLVNNGNKDERLDTLYA
jgi:integrase